MNRNLALIVVVASLTAGAGCVDRQKQDQAKRTQEIVTSTTLPVTVQQVRVQAIAEQLEITGELTTSQDTQIGAKRSGRIVAIHVNDGDPVSAGQLLASLETTDQQAQLQQALASQASARSQLSQAMTNAAVGPTRSQAAVNQAQAQLRSAKALLDKARAGARKEERIQVEWQVKQAESNLRTAEKELERTKTLVEQGALPKARLEAAQNAYMAALTQYNAALQNQAMINTGTRPEDLAVAEAAVRQAEEALRAAQAQQKLDSLLTDQVLSARAAVQSAEAQVSIARQALEDAQIRAPFAGRVSGKPVQTGTVVSPGEAIVRLVGGQGIYFEGEVPEEVVAQVRPGSTAEVSVTALPGRTLLGTVAAISPMGQSVGRLFRVRIVVNGNMEGLKPGMFATGRITVRSVPSATVVPASSVLQREGKSVVFVVEGNKAKSVEVKTGLRQDGTLQVEGVSPDQRVVVKGQEGLIDGSVVKVEGAAQVVAASEVNG